MSAVFDGGQNGGGCSFDRILSYYRMLARIWYCWKHFSIGLDDQLLSGMVVEEEIVDSDFFLVFVSFCHFLFLTWLWY